MTQDSSARPGAALEALLVLVLTLTTAAIASPEQAFEDLVANLKSPIARTRQSAAVELGKSRRREAVMPLSTLARDPEPRVRLEVVNALRQLRDLSAIPALVAVLGDSEARIREEAISALVEIYAERERGGTIRRFLASFSDEFDRASVPPFTAVDAQVVKGLAGALRDEQPAIRTAAAYAIGILDGRGAVADLVAALQDPEPDVRGAAAAAIGKVGSASEGRPLILLLADASSDVRRQAMQAVGVLRIRDAGPPLREMFEQNRRGETGSRVLTALSRIGDPAQADLFRELLSSGDAERRRLAVEGLGRIADASMLVGFKKDYQREKNADVRLAYNFAMVLLGDRPFLDSIVFALGAGSERARAYLLELGPSTAPELYPYLADTDAEVRGAVCDVLAQLGDVAAIDRLQPLLGDPNTKVVDRANRAIEKLRRGPARAAQTP